MKKELKEVEEYFNKFEELVSLETYVEYTEEQMSLVIDKFFENYKYANEECSSKLYKVINEYFPQLVDKFVADYLKNGVVLSFLLGFNRLSYHGHLDEEILTKNLFNNLSEVRTLNLLYYKSILKDYEDKQKISLELEKRIETNEKETIQQILYDISTLYSASMKLKEHMSKKEIKEIDAINEFIYLIIKDICHNEEVEVKDIEFLGCGVSSAVLGIGNKVLKLGSRRFTERFPNNPYVVPMLLRKKIVVNDDISYFIEVTEKCKPCIKGSVNFNESWCFIKKLYALGIEWLDGQDENLGRVTNPMGNVISWKENLFLTDEVLGLDPYRNTDINTGRRIEVLKQGDLVIMDNDYLCNKVSRNKTRKK